jgi:Zn-dependent protease with chaperone function
MIAVLRSLEFFVLAAAVFALIASVFSAGVVGLARGRLARWNAGKRHRAWLLLAALPAIVTLLLLCAISLPSIASVVWPELDHCAAHDDAHAHFCFVHVPAHGVRGEAMFVIAAVVAFAAFSAARFAGRIGRALRRLRSLARTAEYRADLGASVVSVDDPLCIAAGLFRPRVFLSSGLLAALDARERAVVLEHERAHVERRDALLGSIARVAAGLHLPFVRREILAELDVAAEEACDELASRSRDRLDVADTILRVGRLCSQRFDGDALARSFGASALERRVQALVDEPNRRGSLAAAAALTAALGASILGFSVEIHHLTETVLSSLVR